MSQNLSTTVAGVGIDIGKQCSRPRWAGCNRAASDVVSRPSRSARFANMPQCLIGMVACVGAHHLSRKLNDFGHDATAADCLNNVDDPGMRCEP